MKELPSHLVSEDFYIWFNIKEKEEYYSTPLYLYNVLRKDTDKENDEEKKRDDGSRKTQEEKLKPTTQSRNPKT